MIVICGRDTDLSTASHGFRFRSVVYREPYTHGTTTVRNDGSFFYPCLIAPQLARSHPRNNSADSVMSSGLHQTLA